MWSGAAVAAAAGGPASQSQSQPAPSSHSLPSSSPSLGARPRRAPVCQVDAATLSLGLQRPLRPAPTFYPSEAEFADPIAYVQSIRHIGEKAGICKIVPPKSWQPPFCLNEETFQFRSKVQRLDMLQKRGKGGEAAHAWDSAEMDEAVAAAAAAAATAPNCSPRKPADLSGVPAGSPSVAPSKRKRDTVGGAAASATSASSTPAVKRARRKRAKMNSGTPDYSLTKCELCQGADHDSKILLCDECDQGFHIFCLSPPLAQIPATDWFCPSCQAEKMNAFGFAMGRTFTLRGYKEHNEAFTRAWFTKERARAAAQAAAAAANSAANNGGAGAATSAAGDATMADVPAAAAAAAASSGAAAASPGSFVPPSAAEISASFWRIVNSSRESVSVDYGSDLDTEILGSSFPKDGPYGAHSFNVNNLAMAPGSVFNWLDQSMLISGVTVPWLYVGMLFSTFCWHVEDQNMYSINYVHRGACKQWYGVPASSAGRFERKMRQALPDLFNLHPDLLFQLVTMIDPMHVARSDDASAASKDDPELYYLLQSAGEFVVTFPRGYHAGTNHGYNVAESVNFAGVEWLPYGAKCIERYRFFRRAPVFCHEELVWRMSEHVSAAFSALVVLMTQAGSESRTALVPKHGLRDARAHAVFNQGSAAVTAAASAAMAANAIGALPPLHALALHNQMQSLSSFESVWYFAAWLLPALQEMLTRETQGRAALQAEGTVRGKIWTNLSASPAASQPGGGAKKGQTGGPAVAIDTQVSATWQGNPAFNKDAPSDPSLLCWYDGTVIGWTPPTSAALAAGNAGGLYSVRFHEDGLVDHHVLPQHLRPKGHGAATGTGAAVQSSANGKGHSNEWRTYQACVDADGMGVGDAMATSAVGEGVMKKKVKKSAVDFAPEASSLTSCAICRHALYLSCVRCSCCPEKASCLLHAQELCACDAVSKCVYFRHTLWQMQNMLATIESVVNHRSTPAGTLQRAISAPTPVTSAVLPPAAYNATSDMYEQATSASDFPPPADSPSIRVKGTDPDNNFNTYPLQLSTLMPAFSMSIDDDEGGAAEDSECVPLDEEALARLPPGGEPISAPPLPHDLHHPSNKLLSSIMSESRRIVGEVDDYVEAVGLRDERLAEMAEATLSAAEVEGVTRRSIESQLTASAQPNRRFSRSMHKFTLRSAAPPTPSVTPSANTSAIAAEKDALIEASKASLHAAGAAWLARYSPWVARHEEALRQFEAGQFARYVSANGISAAAASLSEIGSPEVGLAQTDESMGGDLIKHEMAAVETQGTDATAAANGAAASGPLTSPPSDMPIVSHAFITAHELESALHEGEKFIGGDDSMLPMCELYGVLLSWQISAAEVSQNLCHLQRMSKSLCSRADRVGESFVRECSLIAAGKLHSTSEVAKNLPSTELAQPTLEEAYTLCKEVATCPVQLSCHCEHGHKQPTGATASTLSSLSSLPVSSLTPSMLSSLSHLRDLSHWLLLFTPLLHLTPHDQRHRQAQLSAVPLSDSYAFQCALQPYLHRLVQLAKIPIKLKEKTRFFNMCRLAVDTRKQMAQSAQTAAAGGMQPQVHKAQTSGRAARSNGAKAAQLDTSGALTYQYSQLAQQSRSRAHSFVLPPSTLDIGHLAGLGLDGGAAFNALNSTLPSARTPAAPSPAHSFVTSFSAIQEAMAQSAAAAAMAVAVASLSPPLAPAVAPSSGPQLTPAEWLRAVAALLNTWQVPPMFQTLYQYWIDASTLFPSMACLLQFSPDSVAEPSAEALAGLRDLDGLNAAVVVQWLQRLNSLCWAGFWWLTNCRRLLAPTEMAQLTPVQTQHTDPSDLLDALPVPPILHEWAESRIAARREIESTGVVVSGFPCLPWCPNVLGHAAAVVARSATPASSSASSKFLPCCADALLDAPIRTLIDIPEAQVLEFSQQQCAEWTERARNMIPAEAFRQAGVSPPDVAVQSERVWSELCARDKGSVASVAFRERCGAGHSLPKLVGMVCESSGLGLIPLEAFILDTHREHCQQWKKTALQVVEEAQRTFMAFYGLDRATYPTLAQLQSQLAGVERTLRQAEALSIWTEESHSLFKLWSQGQAIMRTVRGETQPPDNELKKEPAAEPAPQQEQAAPAAGQMYNDEDELDDDTAAPASAAASAPSAPLSGLASAALSAPPPPIDLQPPSSHDRYPIARSIGDMLDRVSFALTNPLVQSLGKKERETFVGFSHQTLGRYKRAMRAAQDMQVDLTHFREVNYKDLDMLLQATPAQRETIKQIAIRTKGARVMGLNIKEEGGAAAASSAAAATAAAAPDEAADDRASDRSDEDDDADMPRLVRVAPGSAASAGPAAPSLGHTPVARVDVLQLPAPTDAERDDPQSVYARRTVLAPGPSERKRLLEFMKTEGLFTPGGLLPFQGPKEQFGSLHETRKNMAIRRIQDEFHTCPIWTRKLIASTHGNHRRLYFEKQRALLAKQELLKAGASQAASTHTAAGPYRFAPAAAADHTSAQVKEESKTGDDMEEE